MGAMRDKWNLSFSDTFIFFQSIDYYHANKIFTILWFVKIKKKNSNYYIQSYPEIDAKKYRL